MSGEIGPKEKRRILVPDDVPAETPPSPPLPPQQPAEPVRAPEKEPALKEVTSK